MRDIHISEGRSVLGHLRTGIHFRGNKDTLQYWERCTSTKWKLTSGMQE